MESLAKIRHCAFCLNTISDTKIKLCGKCRKRAYCSRDCQVADWSSGGKGQGHKNWCHLECGEEDIDWKVCEVPGKGLGLVAMRQLPARFRIQVESCHNENDHAAIKDLMPIDGSFQQKFDLNGIGLGNGNSALCLRISRANHDCKANADHWYDETFNVVILYSEREILEGEEICINYQLHSDISVNVSAELARAVLQNKWGITCPMNCFCYEKDIEKLIAKSREIDEKIIRLASQGKPLEAFDLANQLIRNHEILGSCTLNKTRTLYDGFQVGIMKKKNVKSAKQLIEKLYEFQSAILSPDSNVVKETERLMNDVTSHRNYLIFD